MVSIFDSVADDLAERGYSVADHFLSQREVKNIISHRAFNESNRRLQKGGIGNEKPHQINEAIRGDYIQWLDKKSTPPEILLYLRRVEKLMHYLNETLFLCLKDFEVHMTVYPVGSYYKRHLDQFRTDDHRKLSIICYLNEGWQPEHGGQLRIYSPVGPVDVLPLSGRIVCFRSDQFEHEVLPATRERLSLTGWILDQFNGLKYL